MSAAGGPNLVEDGLVFYYDTGNVLKSYKGEPTTNLVTNPTFLGTPNTQTSAITKNWVFSGETSATGFQFYDADTSPIPLKFPDEGAVITTGPNEAGSNRRIYINTTLLPNTTYTFSCWMYFGKSFASAWSQFQYDSSNINLTSTYFPAFSTFAANNGYTTGEWFKWEGTLTTEPTTSWCYIGPVISKGSDCLVAMQRMQMEIKPHSTSFVNGTRSNTEGLLDVTGNSSIDLANVSFDSNAQMTFDGTDDWLNIPVALNAGNFTYETVMQASNPSYQIFSAGSGVPPSGGTTIQAYVNSSGALINLYAPVGGSGWQYGSYNNQSGYVGASGAIRHIVVVNSNTNWKTYVNGVLVGDVTSFAPSVGNAVGVARSAMQAASTVSTTVYMLKVYNRALTASEVAQNFNAIKSRFGI